MRKKQTRKNANLERIFSQRQNIQDFEYTKEHRGKVDGENQQLLGREIHHYDYKEKGAPMGTITAEVEKTTKSKTKGKTTPVKSIQAKQAGEKSIDASIFTRRVEKKAYELYEKRGCQRGNDREDWFEALSIVEEEMISGR